MLLLFIIGLSYYLSSNQFILNQLKEVIISSVSEQLRGEITIEGIKGNLFKQIVLENLRVQEPSKEEVLKVRRITVKYSLLYFLLKRNLLSSIQEIKVSSPKVYLTRDRKGLWNVEKIYKVKKVIPEKVPQIMATLKIDSGEVILLDYFKSPLKPPFQKVFKSISASLISSDYPFLFLTLKGLDERQKEIKVKGKINLSSSCLNLDLCLDSWDLPSLGNYLVGGGKTSVKFKGGKFNLNLHLSSGLAFSQLDYQGEIQLRGAGVNLFKDSLPLRDIEGKLYFTNQGFSSEDLKGSLGEAKFKVRGVAHNFASPQFDLDIVCFNLSLGELREFIPTLSKLKPEGEADLSLRLKGEVTDPKITGQVIVRRGGFLGQKVNQVSLSFKYYQRQLELSEGLAVLAGGEIFGGGWVDLSGNRPKILVSLISKDLNSSQLPLLQRLSPQLRLRGKLGGEVIISSASPLKVLGRVEIKKGEIQGVDLKKGEAVFAYQQKEIFLRGFRGEKEGAEVAGSGKIKLGEHLDLKLRMDEFDLKEFKRITNFAWLSDYQLGGSANFLGRLEGKLSSPSLSGDVEIKGCQVGRKGKKDIPYFEEVKGSLSLSSQSLVLPKITLKSGEATHSLSGVVNFGEENNLRLKLDSKEVDLKDLLPFWGGDYKEKLKGRFDSSLSLSGPFNNLKAEGEILIDRANIGREVINRGEAKFRFLERCLYLDYFRAFLGNSEVKVEGKIGLKGNKELFLNLETKEFSLGDLNLIKESYQKAEGKVKLLANLRGTIDKPDLKAILEGDNLLVGRKTLEQLKAEVNYSGERKEFYSRITLGESNYSLKGEFKPLPRKTYALDCLLSVEKGDLNTILNLARVKPEVIPEGVIGGEGNFKGEIRFSPEGIKLENPQGKIILSLTDGSLGNYPINFARTDLAYEKKVITLNQLNIVSNEANLEGEGEIEEGGKLNLKVKTKEMELGMLKPFIPDNIDLAGKIDLVMLFKGTTSSPEIESSLLVRNIKVSEQTFDELKGGIRYVDNLFYLKDISLIKEGREAKIYGKVPFNWEERKFPEDEELDLWVKVPEEDLSVLSSFFKDVTLAEGRAQGFLHLKGTLREPEYEGEVKVSEATLQIKKLENPLSDLKAQITFNKDTLQVDKFSGNMGSGSFNLGGEIKIKKFSPYSYALNLKAENLNLCYLPTFEGILGADLFFAGPARTPKISGEIKVKDTAYTLSPAAGEFDLSSVGLPGDALLDLKIVVGKDVWVKNANLRMETDGGLTLSGSLKEPQISGEIKSSRGTLVFFTSLFKVTEAYIFFEKKGSFEPTLFVKAETEIKVKEKEGERIHLITVPVKIVLDQRIRPPGAEMPTSEEMSEGGVHLEWDDSKLKMPLTKSEVIAYLTHTESIQEIFQGDINQVLQEEVEGLLTANLRLHLFDPFEQRVEEAFNLSEFRLEYDSEENIQLKLGKNLVKNLLVSYATTFSEEPKKALSLSFEFSKNKVLSYSVDEKQDYKLGLGLRYRF